MSSLLPGFEYDIFISYRQKDNRSDQWITNFVQSLREELDATFKEEISIYFDSNPHDGLLETHDVDSSLKEKIKCLVFIPIVSQTYCDPNSFAWQKELLPFLDFAKQDEFGLDIKLTNGNVTKRVLPVRIHEIDEVDKQQFENAIDGIIRPVDFIYKEPGVNRPLLSTDSKNDNQNKTDYRNQVNKVANAIKEIVTSMKGGPAQSQSQPSPKPTFKTSLWSRKKIMFGVAAVLIALAAFLFYQFKYADINSTQSNEFKKSIAVLPFDDLSPGKDQEYFSDGLAEEIINVLMQIPELKVVGRTSSFSYKDSNTDIKTIGTSLQASHLIHGSVRKSGNAVKIQVNLIDAKTGLNIKSYSFPETQLENIFQIQESIAQSVTNDLKLSLFSTQGNEIATSQTDNPEALEEFFKGRKLWYERKNLWEAVVHFEKAIFLDPNYSRAYSALAETYCVLPTYTNRYNLGSIKVKVFDAIEKSLTLNPKNAEAYTAKGRAEWKFRLDRKGAEDSFQKALAINPNYGTALAWFAHYYFESLQFKKAEEYFLRSIAIEPRWALPYYELSTAYLCLDDFEKAYTMSVQSEKLQPDFIMNHRAKFCLALYKNDFQKGIEYWTDYYTQRCISSQCSDSDLEITLGILEMLQSDSINQNYVDKIPTLKFSIDRVFFTVLSGEKKQLLNELTTLKQENSYEFIAAIYQLYQLRDFKNDPEYIDIIKSVNVN